MRAATFIIFFIVAFAIAASRRDDGELWVGTHGFSSFGWPQSWIFVDKTTPTLEIHPDGSRHEIGERTTSWKISWQPFCVSLGVSAAIAAALSLPVFFWQRFKKHDHVA